MTAGDHIYVNRFGYSHHGIDCGDGTVIHYGKNPSGINEIHRVSKTSFAGGEQIYFKEYGICDPDDVVVRRAKSRLGEQAYDLFGNNCEHFAYWCKTGKHKSEQVDRIDRTITATNIGIGSSIPIGIGTQVATQMASEAAIQALNPVSKVLINVGVKQAPKVAGGAAAGIAGVGGIVGGLAADMVVGTMLEDDEHLSQQEREARQTGRTAGQVASTVGAIGGGIAATAVGGGGAAIALAVAAPAVLGITFALGVYHLMKGD